MQGQGVTSSLIDFTVRKDCVRTRRRREPIAHWTKASSRRCLVIHSRPQKVRDNRIRKQRTDKVPEIIDLPDAGRAGPPSTPNTTVIEVSSAEVVISRRQEFGMFPFLSPARTIEEVLDSQVDSPSITVFRRTRSAARRQLAADSSVWREKHMKRREKWRE